MARQTAKVKKFDSGLGYGFIENPDGGKDIFVHYSAIEEKGFRTLEVGEEVEFEVTESEKGLQAEHVRRV